MRLIRPKVITWSGKSVTIPLEEQTQDVEIIPEEQTLDVAVMLEGQALVVEEDVAISLEERVGEQTPTMQRTLVRGTPPIQTKTTLNYLTFGLVSQYVPN